MRIALIFNIALITNWLSYQLLLTLASNLTQNLIQKPLRFESVSTNKADIV